MGILDTGRLLPRARDGTARSRSSRAAGARCAPARYAHGVAWAPMPKDLGWSRPSAAPAIHTPTGGAPDAAKAANEAAFTARFGSGMKIDGCIRRTSRWSGTGNIPLDRARSRRGERVFSRSMGYAGQSFLVSRIARGHMLIVSHDLPDMTGLRRTCRSEVSKKPEVRVRLLQKRRDAAR